MENIPQFLYEMLCKQYGVDVTEKIVEGYNKKRLTTFRVNTLKATVNEVENVFKKEKINITQVPWSKTAFILEERNSLNEIKKGTNNTEEANFRNLELYENGKIYVQSLSSMMPVIALEPKIKENILDMTSAPGSKTTQIAALTQNESYITACEKNKVRAEKLKYNIEKQGVKCVSVMVQDARKLSNFLMFDKILLDAPCSGSGTISLTSPKLEKNFTKELIQRSEQIQYELLKKAFEILKIGHEMVYSTCSILESENESNINKLLSTKKAEIVPINKEQFTGVPLLPSKIEGTIGVCPTELYEGFFMAKLRKIN